MKFISIVTYCLICVLRLGKWRVGTQWPFLIGAATRTAAAVGSRGDGASVIRFKP